MATVKDAVKESLMGTSDEPQPSQQAKANFHRHARKDEATGELFMTEDDFIEAIAPKHEDYVRVASRLRLALPSARCVIVGCCR